MPDYNGVLIYGETGKCQLSPISRELLGVGRKLADVRNEQLSIVLIGNDSEACGQESITCGADKVFIISDAPTENYEGASHTAIMEKLCRETICPAILLFGHTLTGRDLAPRLAFRLKTGLVMDCVELDIEPASKKLVITKPVAGGNISATYKIKGDGIQIATVRSKAMEPLLQDDSRRGEIKTITAGVNDSVVKANVIERVVQESADDIENADIIIAGGRGVGSKEDFHSYLREGLAGVLGGAVAGTRAAVDEGLITEQCQVGLTGKIVGPGLYFAIALSGAIQHITGCIGSKNIVAINNDKNAQIFKFAKYGIVEDYKKILPPLTEKLKEVL